MRKKKQPTPKGIKETPEARKKRVASGVKFRATVFEDKKRRRLDQAIDDDDPSRQ